MKLQDIRLLFILIPALLLYGCERNDLYDIARSAMDTGYLSVIYHPNGADGGDVPVDTSLYQPGQTVKVLGNTNALSKTGESFNGWNTEPDGSGSSYTTAQNLSLGDTDIILYARWTTDPVYSVTYDGNGNTGGDVPVDGVSYTSGQTVYVAGNSGALTKTGNSFGGWETGGFTYTAGQPFTMGSSNVVLLAVWVPDQSYMITYNANGATGTAPTDPDMHEAGMPVTIMDASGMEKPQDGIIMRFTGWNTDQLGGGIHYNPGSVIMPSNNLNLYAQWSVIGGTGPAGGMVFYDKGVFSDGWRYMEVSLNDLPVVEWGADNTSITGLSEIIGAGENNTALIIGVYGLGVYAAFNCQDFPQGGVGDWFLPSQLEMNEIYVTLHQTGLMALTADYYWVSGEDDLDNAFALDGSTGVVGGFLKTTTYLVRPVRSF